MILQLTYESIVQETIFFLRCHAAVGSLNVQQTGLLLLQATVTVMKRENEYLAEYMSKQKAGGIKMQILVQSYWQYKRD